jgi:serine/threonine-protein kinase
MVNPDPAKPQSSAESNPTIYSYESDGDADDTDRGLTSAEKADKRMDNLKKVGEFNILRRLGRGGMGEVYLAEQTSLNRQVALKILRADRTESQTHLQRFKTEAMAAGHLNHTNIVQVYLIGESEGYHFIAQEFVDGRNMREHITKKGPLSPTIALHVMKQVASALQKAAEAGIVHRDIKPENILINRRGVVKIADFGLARLTLRDDINLTQVGMTMGTPTYMSPEQVHGNKVDPRSDIYSFGVTCYHMLTGRPPFYGETALAVAVKHLKDEPLPLLDKRPDIPPALAEMIHKMMAKEPGKRYQTATQIIQDLKKINQDLQKGGGGNIQLMEFEMPSQPQLAVPKKSMFYSRTKFILATLLFLSCGLGVGWLTRTQDPFAAPVNKTANVIEKLPTADAQWKHALALTSSKPAWKAVVEYYPDSPESLLANEQLAILYLKDKNYTAAKKVFHDLESNGNNDRSATAKGIAGKAIIACLTGDYERSNTIIVNDLRRENEYLNGPLRELVREAVRVNAEKLQQEVKTELLKMFQADDMTSDQVP